MPDAPTRMKIAAVSLCGLDTVAAYFNGARRLRAASRIRIERALAELGLPKPTPAGQDAPAPEPPGRAA